MESENKVIHLHEYLNQRPKESVTSFTAKKIKAQLFKRFVAFSTDIFVIGMLKIGFVATYDKFLKTFFFTLPSSKIDAIWERFYVIDPLISISLFYGYFIFCYYSLNGKSIGKKWMKLTVVQDNFRDGMMVSQYPGIREAFLRATGYLMGYTTAGLLFLVPFMRTDRRGVQDFLSQTVTLEDNQLYEYFITSQASEEESDNVIPLYEWSDKNIKKVS